MIQRDVNYKMSRYILFKLYVKSVFGHSLKWRIIVILILQNWSVNEYQRTIFNEC
jgi:hypothetical protein